MSASAGETRSVTLELELGGDALRGTVAEPGGRRREFRGWLGLIAELDRVVGQAAEREDFDERQRGPAGPLVNEDLP